MLPYLPDLRVTETGTATGSRAGGTGWGQGLGRLWEELWEELCSGSDRGKCDSRVFQWCIRAARQRPCVVVIHGSHAGTTHHWAGRFTRLTPSSSHVRVDIPGRKCVSTHSADGLDEGGFREPMILHKVSQKLKNWLNPSKRTFCCCGSPREY